MSTTVWFATNRTEPRGGRKTFGNRFHADGPHFYRVGRAEVTRHGEDDDAATVEWDLLPERRPAVPNVNDVPETTRKNTQSGRTGSAGLFQEIRDAVRRDQAEVLIFIHGFANTFESSLVRAAQLAETYAFERRARAGEPARPVRLLPVAFAWPSDGKVQPPWMYASDRDDAEMSGVAMARALKRFLDFLDTQDAAGGERCPYRVHLVAHSMGNWALRHAIQGLRARVFGARLPKIIDNAFLMAADEDDDCFQHVHKLQPLTELARRVHVYHAENDLALEVSDKTKFNMDRLGTAGPRTFSGLDTRITAIDCSAVADTTLSHGRHQYYRLREEVIRDVRAVLAGPATPGRIPGRQEVEPGRRYRLDVGA